MTPIQDLIDQLVQIKYRYEFESEEGMLHDHEKKTIDSAIRLLESMVTHHV